MFSVRYLLNQFIDFDPIRIDTLLGEDKELIRFWRSKLNFQGHNNTLKCPKYGFCSLSSEPVDGV